MSNSQAEVALSIRDLVECYTEYEVRYKRFTEAGLSLRGSLYTTNMTIVTDLEEWHDRIGYSAFSESPGCEPILEPTLDPPAYGQMITIILGQVQFQGTSQRQQRKFPETVYTPKLERFGVPV